MCLILKDRDDAQQAIRRNLLETWDGRYELFAPQTNSLYISRTVGKSFLELINEESPVPEISVTKNEAQICVRVFLLKRKNIGKLESRKHTFKIVVN